MEKQQDSKEFNHEAGFKIIYEMIESAKSKIGKNYFYYLFWGYWVVAACLLEYFLIKVANYPYHYLVWTIMMPLGCFITLVFYTRMKRTVNSKTFIGTTMGFLWGGWFISFIILLVFANLKHDYTLILPMTMAMYGLAIFVSGGVVQFRPLLLGGIVAWLGSIGAFFVPYLGQLVILTGVVIISYIIPGHLLKQLSKA
jgi:hypothetical protein